MLPRVQTVFLRFLFAALTLSGASGSSLIYTAGLGSAPFTLYQVNGSSGATSLVGSIGSLGVQGMDFGPDGKLYASGSDFFLNPKLLTLDSATGAISSSISITGIPVFFSAVDYAIGADGTLFALYGVDSLYTIDKTTGAATSVGTTATNSVAQTIAYSGGTLFLSDGLNLYTVDQSSGAVSLLTPLTYDPGFGLALLPPRLHMKFDPLDGTIYVTVKSFGVNAFGVLDPFSGFVTKIGSTVTGAGALAIFTGFGQDEAPEVPEPSSWLLLGSGLAAAVVRRCKK